MILNSNRGHFWSLFPVHPPHLICKGIGGEGSCNRECRDYVKAILDLHKMLGTIKKCYLKWRFDGELHWYKVKNHLKQIQTIYIYNIYISGSILPKSHPEIISKRSSPPESSSSSPVPREVRLIIQSGLRGAFFGEDHWGRKKMEKNLVKRGRIHLVIHLSSCMFREANLW